MLCRPNHVEWTSSAGADSGAKRTDLSSSPSALLWAAEQQQQRQPWLASAAAGLAAERLSAVPSLLFSRLTHAGQPGQWQLYTGAKGAHPGSWQRSRSVLLATLFSTVSHFVKFSVMASLQYCFFIIYSTLSTISELGPKRDGKKFFLEIF